jgi:hypothetical protein
MARYQQGRHAARSGKRRSGYIVIVRGRNGRLRLERHDAATYRARLKSMERSDSVGISIDEIAGLLDTQ